MRIKKYLVKAGPNGEVKEMLISIILFAVCFILFVTRIISCFKIYKQTKEIKKSDIAFIIIMFLFILLSSINLFYYKIGY